MQYKFEKVVCINIVVNKSIDIRKRMKYHQYMTDTKTQGQRNMTGKGYRHPSENVAYLGF